MNRMNDLINRQRAIDAARDWYEGLICGSFKGLEKRLRALPPAEPEIIRCKDCKHFAGEGMYCANNILVPFSHFYCYYAEGEEE